MDTSEEQRWEERSANPASDHPRSAFKGRREDMLGVNGRRAPRPQVGGGHAPPVPGVIISWVLVQ